MSSSPLVKEFLDNLELKGTASPKLKVNQNDKSGEG